MASTSASNSRDMDALASSTIAKGTVPAVTIAEKELQALQFQPNESGMSSSSLVLVDGAPAPPELDMLEEDRQRMSQSMLEGLDIDVFADQKPVIGWIEELWVENFKSYGGFQRIGPFGRFTGIVGPNGAGKSNLMDAISFVLGVQSMSIRGNNLKELIHRKEEEADVTSLGRSASVTLVFKDFQKECSINFCRRISSKGIGTFYINGSRVTQSEYFNRFAEYNVLVKAKNFLVFQGDVEDIAQKDPKELSKVFEQISGSDALQESYDNALSEYKRLQYESRHAFIRKKHLENEYKAMLKQQEEADEFERSRERFKSLVAEFYLFKLFVNETMGASWEEQKTNHENLRLQLESKLEELKGEAIRLEQAKLKHQMNLQSTESEVNETTKQLDEMKPKVAKLYEEIEFERNAIQEIRKKIEVTKSQRSSLENFLTTAEKSIKEMEASIVDLNNRLEEAEKQNVKLTTKQQAKYDQLVQQLNEAVSDKYVTVHSTKREIRALESSIDYLDKEIERLSQSNIRAKELSKDAQTKCSEINDKIKLCHTSIQDKKKELQSTEKRLKASVERRRSILEKKVEIEKRLKISNGNRLEVKQYKQKCQVVKDMQESVHTIYGYFTDICHPNSKRFNLAVTASLGKFNDTLITDTFKTANNAIQYLKTHRCDRMDFLPLDSIEKRSFNPVLRSISSNAMPALDCIQFDPVFKPALEYALADTQFVETLEEAKAIAYPNTNLFGSSISLKIITLKGERIMKNGNIVVDTDNGNTTSQFDLNEHNRLEENLNAYDQKLQEIEDMEVNGTSRVELLKREIERLERSIFQMEAKLKIWENQVTMKQTESIEYEHSIHSTQEERKQKDATLFELCHKLETVEKEIIEVETALFSDFLQTIGIPNFRNVQNEIKNAREKKRAVESKLLLRLQKLQTDKDEIQRKLGTLVPQHILEEEIDSKLHGVVTLEENVKLAVSETEQLEKVLSAKKVQTQELIGKKKESEGNLLKFREKVQGMLEEMDRSATKISEIEYKMESADDQARHLLRQALLEGVKFELKAGNMQDLRALSDGKTPQSDVAFDYSALPLFVQNDASDTDKVKEHEFSYEQRISELREMIDKGHPNLKAKEKCDEMREELTLFEESSYSTRKECTAAERKFRAIQGQRRDIFMKCFTHVKMAIDRIYYNLTVEDTTYDVGGQTFLDLDDSSGISRDDDPFLCGVRYHAMPPSARFRDMHLLSGGEKTMAALALLFALQSFHPSPFFVLDEVDASLDPKNVNALARYLCKAKFQAIVISLKDKLFSRVDILIGVLKSRELASSKHLIINLDLYREYEDATNNQNNRTRNVQRKEDPPTTVFKSLQNSDQREDYNPANGTPIRHPFI